MLREKTSSMLCHEQTHHQHQRRVRRCSGCAALAVENATLQRRAAFLERQLRAAGNLQELLAAKDRELTACRARLEQLDRELQRQGRDAKTCFEYDDVEEDGEAPTEHDRQLTAEVTSSTFRRSTANDCSRVGPEQSGRGRVDRSCIPETGPPPCLASKVMEQNSRLKNMVRQLIAERGLTVHQYLEQQERQDVAIQHLLQRLNDCIISRRNSPAS